MSTHPSIVFPQMALVSVMMTSTRDEDDGLCAGGLVAGAANSYRVFKKKMFFSQSLASPTYRRKRSSKSSIQCEGILLELEQGVIGAQPAKCLNGVGQIWMADKAICRGCFAYKILGKIDELWFLDLSLIHNLAREKNKVHAYCTTVFKLFLTIRL